MSETAGRRLPRLLTIMGSGETAPTMVKVHRLVVEQLADALAGDAASGESPGRGEVHGLLLDTPFGFQTNAVEIGARAVTYFRDSVGASLEVAGLRSSADAEGPGGDQIIAKLAELPLVFAGPGSPSYALRQWRPTLVPTLLAEKLTLGGAVTFVSAAALTLGALTVPVYEIYKVGEEPHWLEGLNLLVSLGLPAVLIPHYDNNEGQTHDTRFCYLGEQRLSRMETELTTGTFVLGVDEHTALCVDLDSRVAAVVGRGAVTVRVRGRSERIEAGQSIPIEMLSETAEALAIRRSERVSEASAPGAFDADRGGLEEIGEATRTDAKQRTDQSTDTQPGRRSSAPAAATTTAPDQQGSPLLQAIRGYESDFRAACARSDAAAMLGIVFALEDELWAWRADTLQSDEMDRGRASLRSMIAELGRLSEVGTRDPAEVIGPFVEIAIAMRDELRAEELFEDADAIRRRLDSLGVSVHDTPDGSRWEFRHLGEEY